MYQVVNFLAMNLNTGGGLDADASLPRPQLNQPHDDLLRTCGDHDVLKFPSAQNQHCTTLSKKCHTANRLRQACGCPTGFR